MLMECYDKNFASIDPGRRNSDNNSQCFVKHFSIDCRKASRVTSKIVCETKVSFVVDRLTTANLQKATHLADSFSAWTNKTASLCPVWKFFSSKLVCERNPGSGGKLASKPQLDGWHLVRAPKTRNYDEVLQILQSRDIHHKSLPYFRLNPVLHPLSK